MVHEVTISVPKPESLNKTYEGKHWAKRKKTTDGYRGALQYLLMQQTPPPFTVARYTVILNANARTDIDNRIMAIKYVNDTLEKDLKWIPSDSPKFFKKLTIEQNDDLKKDEFLITLLFYAD